MRCSVNQVALEDSNSWRLYCKGRGTADVSWKAGGLQVTPARNPRFRAGGRWALERRVAAVQCLLPDYPRLAGIKFWVGSRRIAVRGVLNSVIGDSGVNGASCASPDE
jgi:hypothetical protein